jgi:hypothetical protein
MHSIGQSSQALVDAVLLIGPKCYRDSRSESIELKRQGGPSNASNFDGKRAWQPCMDKASSHSSRQQIHSFIVGL